MVDEIRYKRAPKNMPAYPYPILLLWSFSIILKTVH